MFSKLATLFTFASAALASGAPPSGQTVYTFPGEPSWFEGVSVRPNGDLVLTTLSPSASFYVLSEPWSEEPEVVQNITLPDSDGALGLAEVRRDVYAVASGQFENISNFILGSAQVWLVDINHEDTSLAATIPEAGELNGMVASKDSRGDVLIADSTYGLIWKVSTTEFNQSSVWLDAEELKITDTSSTAWPFGINGVQYSPEGGLYFTNTNTRSIYEVETRGGEPVGVRPVAVDIEDVAALDDFIFSRDGRKIYATSNMDNKIVAVDVETGSYSVVLGGEEDGVVAGDTAAAWGRTRNDRDTLYVATSGRAWSSDDDVLKGPAEVVAVKLGH